MALLIGLASCRTPSHEAFGLIMPGMTRDEVETKLGPPTSTTQAPENAAWAERCHWGDTLATLATHATMPDQPPTPRVWTVWFNDEGRVIEVEAANFDRWDEPAPWAPPSKPAR
ncbi:MAG: outer membrane protein assembly factor BamE [Phycisphaerales bacterium]|nr:outer membrane protein assembly factor BamE [Phycisphaerales bacterium]